MKNEMTGLNFRINEMAQRISELREIMGYTPAEMAAKTDVSIEEYIECERGNRDLNFAFLYRCAMAFNVDVTDIIEGKSPVLASYTVTRSGQGQQIDHAHGMEYFNLAASFRNKICEPLLVRCDPSDGNKDIELTTHEGQELDIVVSGTLRVQVGNHVEILNAGDTIYYDSSTPHGMISVGDEGAVFYAIVLNPNGESEMQQIMHIADESPKRSGTGKRIYHNFIHPTEDESGKLLSLRYENEEKFNFAFDIVDGLAKKNPTKLAMLHFDKNKNERRFTFEDLMKYSNQTANYFESLGIKKGDRVMLVLKRHYQFWFSILALHKIGAIAIPATHMLQEHDFDYRFNSAGVSAIVCTSDDYTAEQVDLAQKNSPTLKTKIIVGENRDGWHSFNDEFDKFDNIYERKE
ncbi:MAG: AMP-binding protein, partial [Ruminococcus sp.]|nr:AMP-binding protein [Candidatus Copronaster equi]